LFVAARRRKSPTFTEIAGRNPKEWIEYRRFRMSKIDVTDENFAG
jgi:hypothetical protein